ncbi:hypothetical protein KKF91_21510 [Myxococcota bacterium]|nr:hypothetical protein [Myxococcota bacterium]MBU1433124.1 hypothetical protein [Myxococcota bacterium]MBU1900722.1 hypothetical protein [Myxococcota bacterium]
MQNMYLQEVVQQTAALEEDLSPRRKKSSLAPRQAQRHRGAPPPVHEPSAVDVRITGFWRFKNVVVPPNAYVVHTRRGYAKPLHMGLGLSFRFRDDLDAYLVIPSTMQTIIINASCICKERQGLFVQGYMQWIIDDFSKAYTKLDFSDPVDPMKVVNVQLREQAEATIKDAVATMSIDDVLSDKQPIIEELTRRLRAVAEGEAGLGIRIVTVQIKEAVVSSTKLWEMLQRPFRASRARDARLAELESEGEVKRREDEAARVAAELEIARETAIDKMRGQAEAEAFTHDQEEKARRMQLEAELMARSEAHQRQIIEQEMALERAKLEHTLALEALREAASTRRREVEIKLEAAAQEVAARLSPAQLDAQLIERLPEIARQLPKAEHQTTLQLKGGEALVDLLGALLSRLSGAGK